MKDFTVITSKDNPLLKQVTALQSSAKARKECGLFVLEGLRICRDALENSVAFDKLIVSKTALAKLENEIEILALKAENCYLIEDSLFKKISDTETPQGIIAIGKIPEKTYKELDIKGRYIALENIQDPSNLGAVARTAEALGVSGIILSGGCDPFAPKSLRASMGTLLRMPVIRTDNMVDFIKNSVLDTFACVVDGFEEKIGEGLSFGEGCIVIIGNEANGITAETRMASNHLVTIPMKGKAESLNAAVAASIAMWEMMK